MADPRSGDGPYISVSGSCSFLGERSYRIPSRSRLIVAWLIWERFKADLDGVDVRQLALFDVVEQLGVKLETAESYCSEAHRAFVNAGLEEIHDRSPRLNPGALTVLPPSDLVDVLRAVNDGDLPSAREV